MNGGGSIFPPLVCVVSILLLISSFSVMERPLTPEVFVVGTADGDVVAWDVRYVLQLQPQICSTNTLSMLNSS